MNWNNIVSLESARELKQLEQDDLDYRAKIAAMDKIELLDEMVLFQEERSRIGELTLPLMVKGKILFSALEKSAETQELQLLTGSYRRHLDFEMRAYLQKRREAVS